MVNGNSFSQKGMAQNFRRFAMVRQEEERFCFRSKMFHWEEGLAPDGCLWLPQNEEPLREQSRQQQAKCKTRRTPVGGIQQTTLLMKLVRGKVIQAPVRPFLFMGNILW